MKTGKAVLGIIAGVAAGAILGILLAPDKGSETRKKILNKGKDFADGAKEKFNGALDTISEKYESIKHDAEGMLTRGKSKLDEVKRDFKQDTV